MIVNVISAWGRLERLQSASLIYRGRKSLMNNKPQLTLQRKRMFLDIASVSSTLIGVLLIIFDANVVNFLNSPWGFAHFDLLLGLLSFFRWASLAALWVAIFLAITASLMNPGQQSRWLRRLRGAFVILLSIFSILLVFSAVAAIAHQYMLVWLSLIAIPGILLPGSVILKRRMRERMEAGGEAQQANRG